MTKRIVIAVAAVLLSLLPEGSYAQNVDSLYKAYRSSAMKEFEVFRSSAYKEFEDFRKQANDEFADFMRKAWTELESEAPVPVPDRPEPPKPPVFDPDSFTEPDGLDDDIVVDVVPIDVDIDLRPVSPLPVPHPKRPDDDGPRIGFNFFGLSCSVRVDGGNKEYLRGTSERNAASLWQHFSSGAFNNSVNDCLSLRQSRRLCDWAYYQLAEAFAKAYYGSGYKDEAVVLQAFVLIQSGFAVRLARVNEHFKLLLSCDAELYAAPYLVLNGQRYYNLDKTNQGAYYVCDFAYPGEKPLSFFSDVRPDLPENETSCKTFSPTGHSGISANICNDSNILDFLDSYPYCHWTVYATASLGRSVKEKLYPVLRQAIAGKGEADAANILINFVQTAFEYKTDGDQFGYERPLFADETFYYPYSDCEDRAILYSVLVRELLGLEVALVHYPGHIATAVHFNEDVAGDYFVVNGKHYLICDPTYINADIGMTMPDQNNSEAKLYLLKK